MGWPCVPGAAELCLPPAQTPCGDPVRLQHQPTVANSSGFQPLPRGSVCPRSPPLSGAFHVNPSQRVPDGIRGWKQSPEPGLRDAPRGTRPALPPAPTGRAFCLFSLPFFPCRGFVPCVAPRDPFLMAPPSSGTMGTVSGAAWQPEFPSPHSKDLSCLVFSPPQLLRDSWGPELAAGGGGCWQDQAQFGKGLARVPLRVGGNGWIPAQLLGVIQPEQAPKGSWYGGGFPAALLPASPKGGEEEAGGLEGGWDGNGGDGGGMK